MADTRDSHRHRHISKQELLDAVIELRKSVDQAAAQSAAEFAVLHTDIAIVREKLTQAEDAKPKADAPLTSVFDAALSKLEAAISRGDALLAKLEAAAAKPPSLSNVRLQPENVEIRCCAQQ